MGELLELWLPAFIFGNAFAALWMLLALKTTMESDKDSGGWWYKRCKFWSSKEDKSSADGLPKDSVAPPGDGVNSFELRKPETPGRIISQVQAIQLEWRNVTCVYDGKPKKKVLKDVCGMALPGQLTALMGPSGAGKSTLLDILAMRKNTGHVMGRYIVNGAELSLSSRKQRGENTKFVHRTAYVPQEDNFIPTMTTLETLQFYAGLILPETFDDAERDKHINSAIEILGLTEQRDMMVGGMLPGGVAVRGLSGGQKRRLNIAIGIVSAPSVLFLDEPTSGLDSFGAMNVMAHLSNLAHDGKHTVVASIHQPRIGIWNLLDKVVLLSRGILMYWGAPKDAVPWFSGTLGYKYDAERDDSPPEWLMDLISIEFSKPEIDSRKSMTVLAEVQAASNIFRSSHILESGHVVGLDFGDDEGGQNGLDIGRTVMDMDEAPHALQNSLKGAATAEEGGIARQQALQGTEKSSTTGGERRASWHRQASLLSWRTFLSMTRNPADVSLRMLTFTWVGALFGLVFYGLPQDASSLYPRLNIGFMATTFLMLFPYISISLMVSDRSYFLSDMSARLYCPSAYHAAKALVSLPFNALNAAVFSMIVYGMAGLKGEEESQFRYLTLMVMVSLVFVQALHVAAALATSQDMAFMLGIGFTAINMMFANYFNREPDLKFKWLSSFRAISAMGYVFDGITRSELAGRTFPCPEGVGTDQVLEALERGDGVVSGARISRAMLAAFFGANPDAECPSVSGDGILEYFDLNRDFGSIVAILGTFLVVLHGATFAALVLSSRVGTRR
ncbi:unnamed protein product [Ostreobium quekettii]|uniref:ABC transporter domain-containing protein n=1 Tax=Ostreobium quekettii TaxID=121088 RepID=A0A8S1J761_9CHLO|nr:unnamed protein product [Ostreobium quekettii]